MQRISVDLPEPDGPMTTTTSCSADREVDILQRLEVAEPLVDVLDGDRRHAVAALAHRIPTPSRVSSRWLSLDMV